MNANESDELSGIDSDERETFTDRLDEAGVSTRRVIDVHDGEKKSTDHTRREPENVSGNYGVYAGRGKDRETDENAPYLVDIDIDDYGEGVDASALQAVDDLPETLTVESPHTGNGSGGHCYYVVEGDVLGEVAEAVEGEGVADPEDATVNPSGMSWGEIRVQNQYVVGPGSQLSSCDKEWHDCSEDGEGSYRIAADRPIATIDAADLADVITSDPAYPKDANPGVEGDETGEKSPEEIDDQVPTPDGTRPASVVRSTDWIADRLESGPDHDDYSDSDYAICVEFIEAGVSESDAREFLADEPETKLYRREQENKSPRDYWNRTWKAARKKAAENSEADSDEDIEDPAEHADSATDEALETIEAADGFGEQATALDDTTAALAAATEAGLKQSHAYGFARDLADGSNATVTELKDDIDAARESLSTKAEGREPFDAVLEDRLESVTVLKSTDSNQRTIFRWLFRPRESETESETFAVETQRTKDGLTHNNWSAFRSKYLERKPVQEPKPARPTPHRRDGENWSDWLDSLMRERSSGNDQTIKGPRSEAFDDLLSEISMATAYYGEDHPVPGTREGVLVDGCPTNPDLPDPTKVMITNKSAKTIARNHEIDYQDLQSQASDEGVSSPDQTGIADAIRRDGELSRVWVFDFEALKERNADPLDYSETREERNFTDFEERKRKVKKRKQQHDEPTGEPTTTPIEDGTGRQVFEVGDDPTGEDAEDEPEPDK